jgi:hypothetical protein
MFPVPDEARTAQDVEAISGMASNSATSRGIMFMRMRVAGSFPEV